jgi:hypothetical protein
MKAFQILVSVILSVLIISIYLYTHPEYWSFLDGIPHFDFLISSFFLYLLLALISEFIALKIQNLSFLRALPFILSIAVNLYLSQYFYLKKIGYWETANILHFTKLIGSGAIGIFLIFGLSLLIGSSVLNKREATLNEIPLKTSLGIIILTYCLFFLGFLKLLNFNSILIFILALCCITILRIRRTPFLKFFKSSKDLETPHILGHISLWVLSIFIILNFFENLRPIPKGYDGMTVYANLSFLLKDYGELVNGYGAYNYSLFSSLGLFLLKKPEFVLLTNYLFYLLFLLSFFFLARNFFSLPISLLAVVAVQAIPMLNRMAFMQQKVESSLLFFSIILIMLFLEFLKSEKLGILILAGIVTGFLFGIKYPSIILIIGLLSGLWYLKLGAIGILAYAVSVLFLLLRLKLDDFSGLAYFHQDSFATKGALFLSGLALVVYLYLKKRAVFIKTLKSSLILTLISIFTFLPWAIKNYKESNNFSINSLLYGKTKSPRLK